MSTSLSVTADIVSLIDSTGFVNAQYRFIVHPAGDYTVHFADPDMYVPIHVLSSDVS